MLMHIPAVLNAQEVDTFRRRLLDSPEWVDGRQTVGPQGAEVKRNLQLSDVSALRHELASEILTALAKNDLFFAAALPLRILPPLFNRYRDGGTYGMHVDGAVMRSGDADLIRSDLSCTLFFSQPDEYEGGELVVSDTYGEHDVKLPAGDLILYPSSSLHRVNPVTRGERLGAFFWIQSMIRDNAHRRLLFDMDTAITRLTETQADRASVVKLTGIYHNLLRQWAQT